MNFSNKLYYPLIITFFFLQMNNVFSQKITTEEFLKKHVQDNCTKESIDTLIRIIRPVECSLNKKIKADLNKKQSVILFNNKFPSPCNLHTIKLGKGNYYIELISLGNMAGFKKTIMLPLVKILSQQVGEDNDILVSTYEVRSPTSTLPFHIYTKWEFEIKKTGFYHIQINSDNSSNSNLKLGHTTDSSTVYTNISVSTGSPIVTSTGIITSMLLHDYPVKRSPYGKYRMKIFKQ